VSRSFGIYTEDYLRWFIYRFSRC